MFNQTCTHLKLKHTHNTSIDGTSSYVKWVHNKPKVNECPLDWRIHSVPDYYKMDRRGQSFSNLLDSGHSDAILH